MFIAKTIVINGRYGKQHTTNGRSYIRILILVVVCVIAVACNQ